MNSNKITDQESYVRLSFIVTYHLVPRSSHLPWWEPLIVFKMNSAVVEGPTRLSWQQQPKVALMKHQAWKFWQWRRGSQEMKHCIKRFFWGKEMFVAMRKQGNRGLGSWRALTEPARHLHRWTEDRFAFWAGLFTASHPFYSPTLNLRSYGTYRPRQPSLKLCTHIDVFLFVDLVTCINLVYSLIHDVLCFMQ